MENLIILGSGISGWTAAIYAARAELKPLVISGNDEGGQLTLTTDIENFPGFPNGIPGTKLVENAKEQAERFGARFKLDQATGIKQIKRPAKGKEEGFELSMQSGETLQAKSVIIATGASARWLGLPSEKKYKGRGVSSCATCDGAFYKNKEIIVIGGGDSAMEEANFLTKFASKVTIVHRRDELRASKIMQERTKNNPKIAFRWNAIVEEILGNGKKVTGVKLKDTKTGARSDFKCEGIFLAIGHVPNTDFVKGLLNMNENGYLTTDRFMHTNVPGVFAAGDVQDVRFRQAISAAGSGCMAAMEAEKYLASRE